MLRIRTKFKNGFVYTCPFEDGWKTVAVNRLRIEAESPSLEEAARLHIMYCQMIQKNKDYEALVTTLTNWVAAEGKLK